MVQVKNVKLEKLSRKQLCKLVARLMKLYEIDSTLCPNITSHAFYKNIRYLCYRKYIEKSLSNEPWRELVHECLKEADYLSETFFDIMLENDDYKEIKFWMKKLNYEPSNLPVYVCKFNFSKQKVQNFKTVLFRIFLGEKDYRRN